MEQQIKTQSRQIGQLQKALAQASTDSEEKERLQTELEQVKKEKAETQAELQQIKDTAKVHLSKEIDKAQQALSDIFKDGMQTQIDEYRESARHIWLFAWALICIDFVLIIFFICTHWLGENIGGDGKALNWSFATYSFPVLLILILATTLLRHHKKFLDEVRHFSAAKHQVELYSGLLKASQHAAAHLNDPHKSAEYVQETFGKIRDKLLQYQFMAPPDGKEDNVAHATDRLVEKIIEKTASGKSGLNQ